MGTAANNSSNTPLLPIRRNNVPPEVLATWCTFNEAFGGGRPKQHHRIPAEPLTVNDERDSPGSPVFEELFLPPPQQFAAAPPPIVAANPTVVELINNNNNNNKRNSVGAVSCCCCSSCSGGHSSAGVSCSSKSTPRSSPVPLTHLPETVLYGTREAPVLERHCVEGGEFIIAWLSHSNNSSSTTAGGGNHRVGAAALVPPPALPLPLPSSTSGVNEMQSSTPSANSAGAAAANQGVAGGGGSSNSSNRSFINKPARGWLHSDVVIVREGITYFVRVSRLYYLYMNSTLLIALCYLLFIGGFWVGFLGISPGTYFFLFLSFIYCFNPVWVDTGRRCL